MSDYIQDAVMHTILIGIVLAAGMLIVIAFVGRIGLGGDSEGARWAPPLIALRTPTFGDDDGTLSKGAIALEHDLALIGRYLRAQYIAGIGSAANRRGWRRAKLDEWTVLRDAIVERHFDLVTKGRAVFDHRLTLDAQEAQALWRAIVAQHALLVQTVHATLLSYAPRMSAELKRDILSGATSTWLPATALGQIAAIRALVDTIVAEMPLTLDESLFTLKEIQRRYVPDTIERYLQARAADPLVAEELLNRQLLHIERFARTGHDAIRRGSLAELQANGTFLRERLANADESPPQTER